MFYTLPRTKLTLYLFLMDTFMKSQLQNTQDFQETISTAELCRAPYTNYFDKKDFRIYVINNDARVRILKYLNYLPVISQEYPKFLSILTLASLFIK